MTEKNESTEPETAAEGDASALSNLVMRNGSSISFAPSDSDPFIGVDMASGPDSTAITCPVCHKFQLLVNDDYKCKSCNEHLLFKARYT